MNKKILLFVALLCAIAQGTLAQNGNWSDYRDTDWGTDYDSASSFTITTPEQFAQFAYMVNSGSDFSGKTVTLDDGVKIIEWQGQTYPQTIWFDGDLRDHYWTPIGTSGNPFNGTFDGNEKSVNYVRIDGEDSYQGFFGYIGTSGLVQNLVLDYGSNISGSTQVGALAGYNGGTVQNCVVLNATVSGTSYVGSIIGQNASTATATGCYSINCTGAMALGADGSDTGVDINGVQCLYKVEGDYYTKTSVGTATGVTVGSAVYYDDGIQYNAYHYYKTSSTTMLTYTKAGYTATFSLTSGTGATLNGNVLTIGTSDVTVAVTTSVAEWELDGVGGSADNPYIIIFASS